MLVEEILRAKRSEVATTTTERIRAGSSPNVTS